MARNPLQGWAQHITEDCLKDDSLHLQGTRGADQASEPICLTPAGSMTASVICAGNGIAQEKLKHSQACQADHGSGLIYSLTRLHCSVNSIQAGHLQAEMVQ